MAYGFLRSFLVRLFSAWFSFIWSGLTRAVELLDVARCVLAVITEPFFSRNLLAILGFGSALAFGFARAVVFALSPTTRFCLTPFPPCKVILRCVICLADTGLQIVYT
eukprot:TRINITY_DN16741_c0_g2_i1.p2 TRINITY_DN16741_c0_g2~~TRINITY_DN16741_c0_g2_i1.p2  ORF type:complete len:108 (+),score=2.46 TRINITY_DN16741_c0_g2_i1:20-343(+)